jgi:hypothetical protein
MSLVAARAFEPTTWWRRGSCDAVIRTRDADSFFARLNRLILDTRNGGIADRRERERDLRLPDRRRER